jgi:foldase protein PrsA
MDTTNESVQGGAPQGGAPTPASGGRKAPGALVWVIVAVVVILLVALVAFKGGMGGTATPTDDGTAVADPSTVVATVNGLTITRGELDEKVNQVRLSVPPEMLGANLEKDVLDQMVSLKLLLARASERGLTEAATDARIDTEIAKLVEIAGGQEMFEQRLTGFGLTMEQLRENMKNDIMIRALVDAETNIEEITVTDEELKAAYDLAYPPGGQDNPSFEEVGELFRAQLIDQKGKAIVDAYIQDVRKDATIEEFL